MPYFIDRLMMQFEYYGNHWGLVLKGVDELPARYGIIVLNLALQMPCTQVVLKIWAPGPF